MKSTSKTLLSTNQHQKRHLFEAGWVAPDNSTLAINQTLGNFNFWLPLKMLLGFAEEYTRIIMNVKEELILLRTRR